MNFLGVDIGNVAGTYKIEKDGPNVPNLTLSAQRVGQYLVLGNQPVTNTAIAGRTVADEMDNNNGPDGYIAGTLIKSVLKDNTEVGACACIGCMVIKLTWTTTRAVTTKVPPTGPNAHKKQWETVTTMQPVVASDYILSTAYNVLRESTKTTYTVHTWAGAGSQTHVEQICGLRLRAFMNYLKARGGAQNPLFKLSDFTATGFVRFRGKKQNGHPLTEACNGCKGVWSDLADDFPFLAEVKLAQD